MTGKIYLKSIAFSLIAVLLVSCNGKKTTAENGSDAEKLPDDIVEMRYDQIKLAGIDTGSIKMVPIANTLKVSGKIMVAPQDYATVCAPLGGFIKSTFLLPGNAVRKGETLALIENQEFIDIQENYLEAKSKLEYAEAEFRRHSDLYKEDVFSEKNLQQVTADYKSLKALVTAYEQKLALIGIDPKGLSEDNLSRDISIVSPISGYIKSVNVNVGKSISPTDILFEIVNSNDLLLELSLFEKDANKVSEGQKIKFFINNETEEHEAVIYQTARAMNDDKTYKVYAKVTTDCKNLLPGMYVNALIQTSGDIVAALPSEAIVSFNDNDYIFVFSRNKKENGADFTEYRMVQIHKGITDGSGTEVNLPEGLNIRDLKVVTKGAYNLLSAKKNAGEMAC